MFQSGLFNNPWHTWRSPGQQEDVQTICQNDLFDDDKSSTGDPTDHIDSSAIPNRMDTSSPSAHAQAQAPALVISFNPTLHVAGQREARESEHQNQNAMFGGQALPVTRSTQTQDRCQYPTQPPENDWNRTLPWTRSHQEKPPYAVPLPSSKCRYEEVDFSRSLRQELYEKEEIINKLRKKVQQQGKVWPTVKDTLPATDNSKQNDTVTSLQSDLKQKERELLGLQQALDQIQRGQEQSIRQYEMQFEELRKQFEVKN
ncbi:hypothetical protein EDD15DRAFT_2193488 [Pisolithus albus]|nr:hypothetical protein EDD15DRAFT_2193488 [Pisolithus albus]